jgi:urease accessory protein
MLRVREIRRAGAWTEAPSDRVILPADARNRRRRVLKSAGRLEFLLDRAETVLLRQGDGLVLEDGRIVLVEAADEAILEITAPDPEHLMRIAWHLGNRHLPAEIHPDRVIIAEDHVIAEMVRALGGTVVPRQGPFNPEGGAYGHGH